MHTHVRVHFGKSTFELSISNTATVAELKGEIHKVLAECAPKRQFLTVGATVLEDSVRLLVRAVRAFCVNMGVVCVCRGARWSPGPPTRVTQEAGLRDTSNVQLVLLAEDGSQSPASACGIVPHGTSDWSPELLAALDRCQRGFQAGVPPKAASSGQGSTYFLRDEHGEPVACFKPLDEEPYTPHNTKGWVGTVGQISLRPGVLSGEGCIREAAAFALDHGRLAGVPETALVTSWHTSYSNGNRDGPLPKVGSFQLYVEYEGAAEDWGPNMFSVEDVQRIALLDIRLVNTDRNGSNMLVRSGEGRSLRLVPIDHGAACPSSLAVEWYAWEWMRYPQSKQPVLPELREYVAALDVDADVRLVQSRYNLREPCAHVMRIAGTFLKLCVAAGWSLYDIGMAMCQKAGGGPSDLEQLCEGVVSLAEHMLGNSRVRGADTGPRSSPVAAAVATPPPALTATAAPAEALSDSTTEAFITAIARQFTSTAASSRSGGGPLVVRVCNHTSLRELAHLPSLFADGRLFISAASAYITERDAGVEPARGKGRAGSVCAVTAVVCWSHHLCGAVVVPAHAGGFNSADATLQALQQAVQASVDALTAGVQAGTCLPFSSVSTRVGDVYDAHEAGKRRIGVSVSTRPLLDVHPPTPFLLRMESCPSDDPEPQSALPLPPPVYVPPPRLPSRAQSFSPSILCPSPKLFINVLHPPRYTARGQRTLSVTVSVMEPLLDVFKGSVLDVEAQRVIVNQVSSQGHFGVLGDDAPLDASISSICEGSECASGGESEELVTSGNIGLPLSPEGALVPVDAEPSPGSSGVSCSPSGGEDGDKVTLPVALPAGAGAAAERREHPVMVITGLRHPVLGPRPVTTRLTHAHSYHSGLHSHGKHSGERDLLNSGTTTPRLSAFLQHTHRQVRPQRFEFKELEKGFFEYLPPRLETFVRKRAEAAVARG